MTIRPPNSLSGIPSWSHGIGMGEVLSESVLDKFPELAESEKSKKEVKAVMQMMMTEVTKTIGKSIESLKELDDDEEKCAAATFFA